MRGKPVNTYAYDVALRDHHPTLGGVTHVRRYGTRDEVKAWAMAQVKEAQEAMPGSQFSFTMFREV